MWPLVVFVGFFVAKQRVQRSDLFVKATKKVTDTNYLFFGFKPVITNVRHVFSMFYHPHALVGESLHDVFLVLA